MFLGSCSLVATGGNYKDLTHVDFFLLNHDFLLFPAGHSSESKNVAIWDTLLPQKKAMVACEYLMMDYLLRSVLMSIILFSFCLSRSRSI